MLHQNPSLRLKNDSWPAHCPPLKRSHIPTAHSRLIGFCASAGGIWDTKHLVKCLPEVSTHLESTSLGPLYEAMGTADALQPEV